MLPKKLLQQRMFKLLLVLCLGVFVLAACNPETGGNEPATEEPPTPGSSTIEEQVAEILKGDVETFQLVELDTAVLGEQIDGGSVTLPLVNAENQAVEQELPITAVQLRDEGVTEGIMRRGEEVETVALPPEQNYHFGQCAERQEEFADCGALTILDQERTMISGMYISEETGLTFFEPVDLLLGGDRKNPGLHVFYNISGTMDVFFGEGEEPEITEAALFPERPNLLGKPLAQSVIRNTKIVLDGDVTFYNIDTSTVWSRQEAAFNTVALVYGLIEPLSRETPDTATWGLTLKIKGQEVWVSGGPTSTNGNTLISELTDPNYFLLNPVTDKELHYLFVGYTVSGLYGKAAGIGSSSGGFGGGAGKNHAFGDGRSTSSVKTHWVVMAHEVGHLIGGLHGDGVIGGCTAFLGLFNICGNSLMPAGSAGSPDTRAAFFSDANDANIEDVLSSTLP